MISPILKYPGGKTRELPIIEKLMPKFNNYYEPFLGGGAVWLNTDSQKYFVNDISIDLMNLYHFIKEKDLKFKKIVCDIERFWNINNYENFIIDNAFLVKEKDIEKECFFIKKISSLAKNNAIGVENIDIIFRNKLEESFYRCQKKFINMNSEKIDDIEGIMVTVVKNAIYLTLRDVYNLTSEKRLRTACYWFLREFAYSSMFRFNSKGDFNVPYGGKSYNNKSLLVKLNYAFSNEIQCKLRNTILSAVDFKEFMEIYKPTKNDFVFLDPPYDSEFSTYDQNKFDREQQELLAKYLTYELKASFMLIIKETDFIKKLYPKGKKTKGGDGHIFVDCFDKQYQVSFKNRNNRKTKHLIVTNYEF